MLENELFDAYHNLSLLDKRNELNLEFEKLYLLLNSIHERLNIERIGGNVKPYNKVVDADMSEDEFMDLTYQNLMNIRKDILTLTNYSINYNDNDA